MLITRRNALLTLSAAAAAIAGFAPEAEARGHAHRPPRPWPKATLEEQNAAADAAGYQRIQDLEQLRSYVDSGLLLPVVATEAYAFDPTFAVHDIENAALYAHARPQVLQFLRDQLDLGYRLFHEQFLITSLTRTVAYQKGLVRSEVYLSRHGRGRKRAHRYAAVGDTPQRRSSHITGATVDLATGHLTMAVRDWLRERLVRLAERKAVLALQEGQGCLHTMVLEEYFHIRNDFLA